MIHGADRAIQFYGEVQAIVAVLLGLMLQYFMGEKRGGKIAFTITLSTLFVALFITPAVIEVIGIDADGKVAIALYALSAIMSVEMLAVLIKVLPSAMRIRTKRFLGVENDLPA